MKNGVWWVCATGESVCQGTLCAMHQTPAVISVLSGVRRKHFMPVLKNGVWRVSAKSESVCQDTLCAMYQRLAIISVL